MSTRIINSTVYCSRIVRVTFSVYIQIVAVCSTSASTIAFDSKAFAASIILTAARMIHFVRIALTTAFLRFAVLCFCIIVGSALKKRHVFVG